MNHDKRKVERAIRCLANRESLDDADELLLELILSSSGLSIVIKKGRLYIAELPDMAGVDALDFIKKYYESVKNGMW